ncbi:MAG: VanW family protein [Armatimonadota bacterium]|nr:VanW family protein [Armatimonadota bacterium]
MKKVIGWTAGALLLAGAGFAAFATLQQGETPKGTTLAGVDASGLGATELRARLEAWWLEKRNAQLSPRSNLITEQPNAMSLGELGIHPDFGATVAGVDFVEYTDSLLGREVTGKPIKIVWKQSGAEFRELAKFVDARAKPEQEASIEFRGGHFIRKYEVPSFVLDESNVGAAALALMVSRKPVFELPMKTAAVGISNETVDGINVVVRSFSTRFSAGNRNRSNNIRLASGSLSGVVLLPGDVLSYNETVGRRTQKAGYKLAGVYANGRHEVDIGGGICQVSTTLFNAVALADLEIVNRQNHSMPVPYVSVGRDATVDYGSIDLKVKNNYDSPIAISSEVKGGTITFYVLGSKKLDYDVRLETSGHSSWGNGVKYVSDGSLAPGTTKVVEKGSSGRKCTTWRVLEKDGVEIKRERMFDSIYRASPRIIARGPKAKARAKPTESTPPAEAIPQTDPIISSGGG